MEWIRNKNLKQSFFIITALFLSVGLLLAALSFYLCLEQGSRFSDAPGVIISLQDDSRFITSPSPEETNGTFNRNAARILAFLQLGLPVFWVILSLLLADVLFYNLKIRRPLALLREGAARISRQDLDFTLEPLSRDELGQLCTSFETMRSELKNSHLKLWRQMEERKRLNAAFAHDLKNPVTVLKGSALLLQKGIEQSPPNPVLQKDSLALILQYTGRLEAYIEAMSHARNMEALECHPVPCSSLALYYGLKKSLPLLAADSGRKLETTFSGTDQEISIDRQFFLNTAENLVCNALRYAKSQVSVEMSCTGEALLLTVTDDGPGYPALLLQKGPAFFRREDTSGGDHLGMGLATCRLLCEKHGGSLTLANRETGAQAKAVFKNRKS